MLKKSGGELGYTLFVRKNSGIQLTNAGRIFLSSAKIIVSEMAKDSPNPTYVYRAQKHFSLLHVLLGIYA